jgi:phage terminase large subunit
MGFEVTTAVRKMLALQGSVKVVQGATSSGKTYGIIPILYDRALATPNTLITVVAETIPSLKDGCVKIFQDFLIDEGRWRDENWLGNPMQYRLPNRSKIQFKSFDTEGRAKASGKREILFINEANHVPYPIADALIIRTTKEVWLDFNADSQFWAHKELVGVKGTDFLKLTYLDNESIPEGTLIKMLERKAKAEEEEKAGQKGYWWNWWQVYGLGEIGSLQGVVFNNWSDIDFVPNEAKLLGYGMDFGYTNDPTTLTAIYSYNNEIILDELIYRTGLTNSDIANLAKPLIKNEPIYADSSEPKSITELQRAGLRMVGATKGADSIMHGLQLMQGQYFRITKRSTNLINEFRNYTWATDKNGMTINKPIDAHNHAIDGIRYYFLSKDKFTGKYYASI